MMRLIKPYVAVKLISHGFSVKTFVEEIENLDERYVGDDVISKLADNFVQCGVGSLRESITALNECSAYVEF